LAITSGARSGLALSQSRMDWSETFSFASAPISTRSLPIAR
jgi:hypothetical protein